MDSNKLYNLAQSLSAGFGNLTQLAASREQQEAEKQWQAHLADVEHRYRTEEQSTANAQQLALYGKEQEQLTAREADRRAYEGTQETSRRTYESGEHQADRGLTRLQIDQTNLQRIDESGRRTVDNIDQRINEIELQRMKAGDDALAQLLQQQGVQTSGADPAGMVDSYVMALKRQRAAAEYHRIERLSQAGDPYYSKLSQQQQMEAAGMVQLPQQPGDAAAPTDMTAQPGADLGGKGVLQESITPGVANMMTKGQPAAAPAAKLYADKTATAPAGGGEIAFKPEAEPSKIPQLFAGARDALSESALKNAAAEEARYIILGAPSSSTDYSGGKPSGLNPVAGDKLKELRTKLGEQEFMRWAAKNFTRTEYQKLLQRLDSAAH